MPDSIEIRPVQGPVHGVIRPPGSKSLTNRALLIAALADGCSILRGTLDSVDTQVMVDSLQKLGVVVDHDIETSVMKVTGVNGNFDSPAEALYVNNSGTTIRFLTAALAFAGGDFILDGSSRMRERPIGPLVESLNSLGAHVSTGSENACPPVTISCEQIKSGRVTIRGDVSSQYLSGLLMAAPLASGEVEISIEGPLISKPYVQMTMEVMRQFGVDCQFDDDLKWFQIDAGQQYASRDFEIEPDASAASYFWAAAAICGGEATVEGLNQSSLQGDVGFVNCLEAMGCDVSRETNAIKVCGPARNGIDVDMSDISDTVQTLTAIAIFLDGPTRIRNVAHNRVKETDRIGNLAIELRKLGAQVNEFEDGLEIIPGTTQPALIETYDDHRMAMSLALTGLRQPGVRVQDPDCVAKTYPNFFNDLELFVRPS